MGKRHDEYHGWKIIEQVSHQQVQLQCTGPQGSRFY